MVTLFVCLFVLAWVFCGILSIVLACYFNSEDSSVQAQVEDLASDSDAIPGFFFACLMGPLLLAVLLLISLFLTLPKIEFEKIAYYIPHQLAKLIDWLLTKPDSDMETKA